MKSLSGIALIVLILSSCQKKSLPAITERPRVISRTVDTITRAPDISIGKQIFSNKCGRCHGLPEPAQFSDKRWDVIVPLMATRAGLKKQDEIDVLMYLKENN